MHAHAEWKYNLKRAIREKVFDRDAATVRLDNVCAFGAWLHNEVPILDRDEHYRTMLDLHRHFHIAVSEVLALALNGETAAATHALESGSEYYDISLGLSREMTRWINRIDKAAV
jgi:hypothetical protein